MPDVLVDTDVFIDHLRGHRELVLGKHCGHVSVITRAELMAGSSASELIKVLLDPLRELAVDRVIVDRAGRVARESGIKLSDALIAATALEHGLSMVTRNTRDFEKVRGLRLRSLA